jgi:hypothetical protein
MNNLKKIIITSIIIILIILSVAFFYFFRQINDKYPASKIEEFAIGVPFEYSYDKSFQLTVTDFSILKDDELRELDEEVEEGMNNNDLERVGYLITLKIKNIGKEKSSIENQEFTIQSGGFTNGSDMVYASLLNEDVKSGAYDIGEERTIIMPFTAVRSLFSKEHWDNIEKLKYELVTSLYPVEQKVLLN